jgi:hypothetical protein
MFLLLFHLRKEDGAISIKKFIFIFIVTLYFSQIHYIFDNMYIFLTKHCFLLKVPLLLHLGKILWYIVRKPKMWVLGIPIWNVGLTFILNSSILFILLFTVIFFLFLLLFICAYKAWFVSPPCYLFINLSLSITCNHPEDQKPYLM